MEVLHAQTKGAMGVCRFAYRIDESQGLELVAVPCPVEGAVNLGMGVGSSGGVVEVVVELCKVMNPPVILQTRELVSTTRMQLQSCVAPGFAAMDIPTDPILHSIKS